MEIFLSEYNDCWPESFEQEKASILKRIGNANPIIEHIGSTAVPGLTAKPIIDIMIGLADFAQLDSLLSTVRQLGYTYFSQYENVMPQRRFFKKFEGPVVTHHIHMVQVNSEFWIRHLLFRDYLRSKPEVMKQYAELKQGLALNDWGDSNDFSDAKTDFIRNIERQARNERPEFPPAGE